MAEISFYIIWQFENKLKFGADGKPVHIPQSKKRGRKGTTAKKETEKGKKGGKKGKGQTQTQPEADVGRALFENTGTFRELFGAVFGRFGGWECWASRALRTRSHNQLISYQDSSKSVKKCEINTWSVGVLSNFSLISKLPMWIFT